MLRKQWQTVVLKLIRRNVSTAEKKKIQPLLQKAFPQMEKASMCMPQSKKGM